MKRIMIQSPLNMEVGQSFNYIGIGNVFRTRSCAPAAFTIYTMNIKGNKYTAGHSNILIENNIIENSYPAAIYAYGVKKS